MMSINKRKFSNVAPLRYRLIATMLTIIMVLPMFPFGTMVSVSAASVEPSFVFTDKNDIGISGIVVTLTGTNGEASVVSQESISSGVANFEAGKAIVDSKYNYSVATGEYAAAATGQITITDSNTPIPITLYAPAPTGSISPLNPTSNFGNSVTLQANASGMGQLSYQWLKDGVKIDGATNSSLIISPLLFSNGGTYSCEVVSSLSDIGVKLTLAANLSVSEATPNVSLEALPVTDSPYSVDGVTLKATVANQTSNTVAKPSGNVEFFVNDVSIGTVSLSNGVATKSGIHMSIGTDYNCYAKYLGTNDSNYGDAKSSTLTYQVNKITPIVSLEALPVTGSPYSTSGVTLSATVAHQTSNTAPKPTGNVEFFVNNVSKGTISLNNGVATLSGIQMPVGTDYSCSAKYYASNDSNYADATSSVLKYQVSKVTPIVSLEALPVTGSPYSTSGVTLKATVAHQTSNTAPKPTGNVEFFVNDVSIGTVSLSNGVATKSGIHMSIGTGYSCYVKYYALNDSNYADATSSTLTYQVSKITPIVSLSAQPVTGSTYSKNGVTLSAAVANQAGDTAPKPTGNVEFFVNNVSKGTVTLNNGVATLSGIQMISGLVYSCSAIYSGVSDTYYTDATSNDISYEVSKTTPVQDTDYTLSTPNGNNGWFKNGGAFEISPKQGGLFDCIKQGVNGELKSTLIFTDETAKEGKSITFYLENSVTHEISNSKTVIYKLDNSIPTNVKSTTPSQYNYVPNSYWNFMLEFNANDSTSGITKFIWYENNGNPHEVTANDSGKFISQIFWLNFSKLVAVDVAGNRSIAFIVANRSIDVTYSAADRTLNANGDPVSDNNLNSSTRYFYQADKVPVSVTFSVSDNSFSAEGILITVNGKEATVASWIHDDVKNVYVGSIPDLTSDGEYIVSVTANGYTISSTEFSGDVSNDKYTSNPHIIDTTPPKITVDAYDPAILATGNAAYADTRTAVFAITEKYFRPNELEFSSFSATDIQGDHILNENEVKEALLTSLKNANWTTDADLHISSAISFSTDAKYSFTLKYTDFADNVEYYTESTPFIIDKSSPENLHIVYAVNPVSTLLQVITFGFYKPSVTIQLYADDSISGIDHFNWTYTQENGTSTTLTIPAESAQINFADTEHFSYTNNGKTAVATFTLNADTSAQYRGSISFTATDKAGHVSDIHFGDGKAKDKDGNEYDTDSNHVVVVDTINPVRSITYPVPQQIRDNDTLAAYTGDKEIRVNTENINSIIYYDNTYGDVIPIALKITEANFYADDSDLIVKVNDTPYTIGDWKQNSDQWTGTIKLADDGAYTISVEYTDHSGNVMTPYQSELIVVDRVKPVIDRYEFKLLTSDGIADTSAFIEKLEYGFYFKTDIVVNIYTSDTSPSSGLDIISYRLVPYDNGVKQAEITGTLPASSGVAKLTVPSGFKGQIFVESFDNTGNKSVQVTPQSFADDKESPTINIVNNNTTSYTDANSNNLFVADLSMTATITDTVSGIKEIGYAQSSEKASFARKNIVLANTGYNVGDILGDGWVVSAMDENLVTKVTNTFSYNTDDNDIILTFDATDRCGNKKENAESEKFTLDKTAPIINISFRTDDDTDVYYNANRIVDITVIERNFDTSLIKAAIENKFGSVPGISFTEVSNNEHTAVVEFDEGDYTFTLSGTDRGSHTAAVTYSGGNENLFYVDKTKPLINDNFAEFTNIATDNSFNKDKTVTITITEHNFDTNLVKLRILRKDAGADHSAAEMVDVTADFLSNTNWVSNGDKHNITFTMSVDAVYMLEVSPADLAGNAASPTSTVIFEIDKTVPIVSAKSGSLVVSDDIEFLDVYTGDRKNDPVPTVNFSDLNIDHIKYVLTVWIPDYSNPETLPSINPVSIYLDEDTTKAGIIKGGKFTLPDFTQDGVYALELVAVDTAGNESALNTNTYARMIDQDVLAFIMNSNAKNKTGVYSFQYENGNPISMRPDNFSDLTVFVLAKRDSITDIVLRDNNAEEIYVDTQVTTDESIYGFTIYNFIIKSDFFKENFSGDTDTDLFLSVKSDGKRIDLGKIHIDNVAPTCDLPSGFSSWHWYFGEDSRTITLTSISELLNEKECKVYDNGKEIAFIYSSKENTITFTLNKGWHNVGVELNDVAGNENSIQEKVNMNVGYFWLWIIIAASVIGIAVTVFLVINNRIRRRKLENE